MKKRAIKKVINFEDVIYTYHGYEFIFYEDIHKIIGKKKMKKWDRMSMGSTALLLVVGDKVHAGVFTCDLKKFMRLDAKGL